METKSYSISEMELNPIEAEEVIIKMINTQINNYRIKSLQDWERDHSSKSKWEDQIQKLMDLRSHWGNEFKKVKNSSHPIKVNISLELDRTPDSTN